MKCWLHGGSKGVAPEECEMCLRHPQPFTIPAQSQPFRSGEPHHVVELKAGVPVDLVWTWLCPENEMRAVTSIRVRPLAFGSADVLIDLERCEVYIWMPDGEALFPALEAKFDDVPFPIEPGSLFRFGLRGPAPRADLTVGVSVNAIVWRT